MSADDDPSPLRHFLTELDDLRSADAPDMDLDPRQGTWRKLAPADPGRPHR